MMHLTTALVATLLAAQSTAFFIPPYIEQAAREYRIAQHKPKLSLPILAGTPVTVNINCPGCPYLESTASAASWVQGVENKIHLELTSSLSAGLRINNATVLPSSSSSPSPAILTATQIRSSDGTSSGDLPLDFALERLEPISSPSEPDTIIIPVRLTIFAIGGQSVKVDTIAIDMVRTRDTFSIGRVSSVPFATTPGAAACEGASRYSLCRINAMISERLKSMLAKAREHVNSWRPSCQGRKQRGQGKMGHWLEGKPVHKGDHHDHKHRGHHHKHGRIHRLAKFIHQTLRFFIIPAMLGVLGGLMASAVGMMVGQCLIWAWQAVFRKNRRTELVETVTVQEVLRDQKLPLVEEDERPPQYRDAEVPPAYAGMDAEAQTKQEKQ